MAGVSIHDHQVIRTPVVEVMVEAYGKLSITVLAMEDVIAQGQGFGDFLGLTGDLYDEIAALEF